MARLNAASLAAPATQQRPPGSGALGTLLDSNGQDDKERFHQPRESQPAGYLKTTRVPPLSRFVLERGTVIPAALPQSVVSDLPGDLIAEVSRDVFDSPTGKFLLIPAGSRLVGEYNSRVSFGQKRIQIAWTAVYFPDGSFLDLGRMPAQAADGGAGLADQVDNHWKRLIGGVALSSILAAGLSVSQNRSSSGSVLTYPSAGQQAAAAVGTQATEAGAQITNRNLNVQPSLKIRPGELFSVFIERDIVFSAPYEAIR
jgi:type IV secretion system protein VirB10